MRRVITLIGAGMVAASVLAGCADSGYDYVKSSSDRTYFKVPSNWTLFDEEEVVDRTMADLTDTQREQVLEQGWRVAFDASPNPTMRHLSNATSKAPTGLAEVKSLSFDDSDALSTYKLRNYFVDIDAANDAGAAEVLSYEDLKPEGGFRGVHVVARLLTSDGITTVDQTVLVDQATTKVYALIVSCSDVCYDRNAKQIKQVVDSWTVRAT